MTRDEFVEKYRSFSTKTRWMALAERDEVNRNGIEGGGVCYAVFMAGRYTLMLKSTFKKMLKDDLISKRCIVGDSGAYARPFRKPFTEQSK